MGWKNLAPVAVLSLLQFASGAPGSTRQASYLSNTIQRRQYYDCATGVHIIGVRGNSSDPPYPYGALQPTILGLEDTIPGSTDYAVDYPKDEASDGGAIGRQLIMSELESYSSSCPDTPIVLAGYSRGGIMTMDVTCGLDTAYQSNVIAIIVYGEETQVADQPYNYGTCTTSAPFARSDTESCLPWSDYIQSYCDYGDDFCCSESPNYNIHRKYPEKYDSQVFEWVQERYDSFVYERR